eukprot:366247-Chlamydomonas_euryale.AAC.5
MTPPFLVFILSIQWRLRCEREVFARDSSEGLAGSKCGHHPTSEVGNWLAQSVSIIPSLGCIPQSGGRRMPADAFHTLLWADLARTRPKTAELSHSHTLVFARSADSLSKCISLTQCPRQGSASLVAGCCVSATTS